MSTEEAGAEHPGGKSDADLPLHGCTVVDLSSGIAGAYCTRLLRDGGALVVKVEDPQGDPLRRWSASGADIPADRDGALFAYLSGGKHSVVADPARRSDLELVETLLAGADVVVWSRGSALTELPGFTPADIRRDHPHTIVTAITAFGLEGPWADRPATEFTLQAWSGGIIGLGRGDPERPPVHVGGRIGEWFAGAHASAATLIARLRGAGTDSGELVDLSVLETQILGLTYFPVTFHDALGRPFRTQRRLSVPGVATAADGLVSVGCGTAQQWFDLCAIVGHPEWIDEDTDLTITERAGKHAEEIHAWFATQPVEAIRALATAFRIPTGLIADGATAPHLDHHAERGTFVTDPAGFLRPRAPFRATPPILRAPAPAPRLGEHTDTYRHRPLARITANGSDVPNPLPLTGIRVLDLTTFWAGPSCTHVLAMLGAEVIHVESAARPDGTRLIAGVPVTEDSWWERSPIFAALNTGKKSITLDWRDERGRDLLRRLAATCDVVVENYTPRVMEQIGLDHEAYRALRPDGIMVRMPGFGLTGPWRDNPAFAYVIEDTSGITNLTGHPDANPIQPYSIGDPNAGIHALNALLMALEHRRNTGEGVLVEAAMVEAALSVAAEQVIEYSAYGALLRHEGNRGPEAAPQNLYRCAGADEFGGTDRWVAIAVTTDAQWEALRKALGEPCWAITAEFDTAAGRRHHHDEIDTELAAWCAERTDDEIIETLWPAGVPVARVLQPHRQGDLAQLAERGFFETVDHPVLPPARYSTIPARFTAGPQRWHGAPAPLLGEHTSAILSALGMDADELADLEASGVIGGLPGSADKK